MRRLRRWKTRESVTSGYPPSASEAASTVFLTSPSRIPRASAIIQNVRRLILEPDQSIAPQLSLAVDEIARGAIVAFPTDTFYGLAADPRSTAAIAGLLALKGRDAGKTIALIAADREQVDAVVALTRAASRLAERFWPGPLTLVCAARRVLAAAVVGPSGGVGVRVPAHDVARALAAACGHAITATSANRSGEAPTADPDVVARELSEVAVVIDAGPSPGGPASTVVDLTGAAPALLRAGAISWQQILDTLLDSAT